LRPKNRYNQCQPSIVSVAANLSMANMAENTVFITYDQSINQSFTRSLDASDNERVMREPSTTVSHEGLFEVIC